MGRRKKRRKNVKRRRVRPPKLPATPVFLKKVEHSDDIKTIYTHFLAPLKSEVLKIVTNLGYTTDDIYNIIVNYFFRVNDRSIYFCKAIREFQLPGEWVSGATTNIRTVPVNAAIFVRYDQATKFIADVEYLDQNFRLSAGEWDVVRTNLKVIV